jgi:uncharacterized protein (TIGR02996 family)
MSAEDAFIRAILSDPRATAPRLVYADWLEERGDTTSTYRAEYLRVECALDALPPRDRGRRKLQDRLRWLRMSVGDDWWRQLDWAGVEYCVEFEYRCPQRWDTLLPTDDSAVRHCSQCQRNVHYCRSAQEAHRLADAGECVAIDSRLVRLPMGRVRAAREAGRLLGKVAPTAQRRPTLGERGAPPAPQNSL